ncbi:unnamed protein product [Gordionus sp. m RMFG-2023]
MNWNIIVFRVISILENDFSIKIQYNILSFLIQLRVKFTSSPSNSYLCRIDFSIDNIISDECDLPSDIKFSEAVQEGNDIVFKKVDKDGIMVNVARYPNSFIDYMSDDLKVAGKTHRLKYVMKTCEG